MYWVYVLIDERNGRRYIGSTADLDRRIAEHRLSKPHFHLAYKESCLDKSAAFKREMYFKSGNGRRALTSLLT